MQMAIIDRQAQGWVIETRSLTPSSESTCQMLLTGLGVPSMATSATSILSG
jgi:hypothetical protein